MTTTATPTAAAAAELVATTTRTPVAAAAHALPTRWPALAALACLAHDAADEAARRSYRDRGSCVEEVELAHADALEQRGLDGLEVTEWSGEGPERVKLAGRVALSWRRDGLEGPAELVALVAERDPEEARTLAAFIEQRGYIAVEIGGHGVSRYYPDGVALDERAQGVATGLYGGAYAGTDDEVAAAAAPALDALRDDAAEWLGRLAEELGALAYDTAGNGEEWAAAGEVEERADELAAELLADAEAQEDNPSRIPCGYGGRSAYTYAEAAQEAAELMAELGPDDAAAAVAAFIRGSA